MQKLTNADTENLNKLQGLSSNLPLRELKAKQYIVDSFTGKMPTLIPLATENKSVVNVASYLLKYTIGSKHTLYRYVFGIHRFCDWIGKTPDEIIGEAQKGKNAVDEYIVKIDEFIGDMQAENLAAGTINNHVKGMKALFRINSINLTLPYRIPKKVRYPDRAPTPEELTQIIDQADLREKVIVSLWRSAA